MSETLESVGSNEAGNQENEWSSLEAMPEMGDATPEPENEQSSSSEKLKPVGELTTEEAGKEYIDLLVELSENFTSAEGRSSRAASPRPDGSVFVYGQGYSGHEDRVVERIEGKDGAHMDREWTLGLADNIIHAESDWRAAGESTTIEEQEEQQGELDANTARRQARLERFERGFGGRMRQKFFPGKHGRLLAEAENAVRRETEAGQKTKEADEKLKHALEAAYSDEYGYGHHRIDDERKADEVNDEYNEKFFGDEERQRKIDRAVELRRRLVSDDVLDVDYH